MGVPYGVIKAALLLVFLLPLLSGCIGFIPSIAGRFIGYRIPMVDVWRANSGRLGVWSSGICGVVCAVCAIFSFIVCSQQDYWPSWTYNFLHLGSLEINFKVFMHRENLLMVVVVAVVSFLVQLYSYSYMSNDPNRHKFIGSMSLFTFSMLLLVVADDVVLMLAAWELVGVMSYIVVSFWYTKNHVADMGYRVAVMNKVGDVFLVIFVVLSILAASDLVLPHTGSELSRPAMSEEYFFCMKIALVLACSVKSAQGLFHAWLPCAMVGPTPASALMHAATMVTAGVLVLTKYYASIDAGSYNILVDDIVFYMGLCTVIGAGTFALFATDLKRIIAYSTCSQLGYMFLSVVIGKPEVTMFHLITHAFFKCSLFLCAANIIQMTNAQHVGAIFHVPRVGMSGQPLEPQPAEIVVSIGQMPATFLCMLLAVFAMTGMPFTSGYYSKEAILQGLSATRYFSAGLRCPPVEEVCWCFRWNYLLLLGGSMITSMYSYKMMFEMFHVKHASLRDTLVHRDTGWYSVTVAGGVSWLGSDKAALVLPILALTALSQLLGVYWDGYGSIKGLLDGVRREQVHFDFYVFGATVIGLVAAYLLTRRRRVRASEECIMSPQCARGLGDIYSALRRASQALGEGLCMDQYLAQFAYRVAGFLASMAMWGEQVTLYLTVYVPLRVVYYSGRLLRSNGTYAFYRKVPLLIFLGVSVIYLAAFHVYF